MTHSIDSFTVSFTGCFVKQGVFWSETIADLEKYKYNGEIVHIILRYLKYILNIIPLD